MDNRKLLDILYKNKDEKYKEFNDKIINTKMPTIGVRMPILKKIAKNISKGDYDEFLSNVNSNYYEEVLIRTEALDNSSYITNMRCVGINEQSGRPRYTAQQEAVEFNMISDSDIVVDDTALFVSA